MPDVKKDAAELQKHLRDTVHLLRTAGAAFDAGDKVQAVTLAANLRVLLHDTRNSTSLLLHLGVKDGLQFIDTCGPRPSAGALMVSGGLTHMLWKAGAAPEHIAPLGQAKVAGRLPFEQWWKGFAMGLPDAQDRKRMKQFTRQDFVLITANQDGGAHVDDGVDATYFDLTRRNALGEVAVNGRVVETWDGNPVPAAIRQITYEVVTTLEEQASGLLH